MEQKKIVLTHTFLLLLFIELSFGFVGKTAAQNVPPSLTIIEGYVVDSLKGDSLPFVNVSVAGTTVGTTSDEYGHFQFTVKTTPTALQITAVGYRNQILTLQNGQTQGLTVRLANSDVQLATVEVHQTRYRNRGNPAVELIQKVIANKSNNRLESHSFYQFEQYEKLDLELENVPDKIKQSRMLKNVSFLFDDADTTTLKGKELIPLYQRETVSDVYFRKASNTQTAFVRGSKHTDWQGAFDDEGFAAYLSYLYVNVDIYDNEILLFKKPFLSPLSPLSPQLYRFYIIDTANVAGQRCINLAFFPRNRADLTFEGNLYITDDSTYAIRKVTMSVPNSININFLNGMSINQKFDKLPNAGWTLVRDEITLNLAGGDDSTKTFGIFGKKTTFRRRFLFDKPAENRFYHPEQAVITLPDAEVQPEIFWATTRQEPLSKKEQKTYVKIDRLTKTADYKLFAEWKYLVATGYFKVKNVEFGPFGALYSYNALEGSRTRVGFRTTYDMSHHFRIEGYAAYGSLDKKWKYSGALTYQLNDNFFNNRPQSAFRLWGLYDVEVPGQTLEKMASDNILTSLNRSVFNKMYYKRAFGLSYINENNAGFMYKIGVQQRELTPAGSLRFDRDGIGTPPLSITRLTTNEATLNLRFAPNEEYFQGQTYRKRIVNKYPVYGLNYTYGAGNDGTGRNFNYQSVSADVFKRFFIAPFGHTDVRLEAGRVFGKNLPYPMLHVFQANQTLNYEQFAFNQMNYLEFISDKYAFLNIEHAFDGFILNKIPLIKKLKWREFMMFKAVYGGLDAANNPATNPSVYRFPTDAKEQSLTYNFDKKPYVEVGFGISNIFKVLRVNVTRRLNYLDHPNASKWGVSGQILFDF